MTNKEKIHQILSSLWKNDNAVGTMDYNQALQDVQTAVDMIDEKTESRIPGEAVKDYVKSVNVFNTQRKDIIDDYIPNAFKAGAVWHPASEEPADRSQCLVVSKRGSKDIVTYSNQFFYKGHVVADPCKLYRLAEITMWAYIEDLLPTSSAAATTK